MPSFNIVFEGCCHGSLDAIYNQISRMNKEVDLVLIGGDFQAVRAPSDLQCMSVPVKFRKLGDFQKYYDGSAKAPYLTIFIGGNHEASNYLQELYYGGWVAPNIYYLGACGMITYKNVLKISGLSGIYNHGDYYAPRAERVPYTPRSVRTIYHVRKHEVDKLKMLQSQRVDLMLSHDWPAGIEHYGNLNGLLQKKKFFKADIERGQLGSPPAMEILRTVKPGQWFSAHLHVRFVATMKHESYERKIDKNTDEIVLEDLEIKDSGTGNEDEVTLDMASDFIEIPNKDEINMDEDLIGLDDTLNLRKDEFSSSTSDSCKPTFYNATKFLALDKCMPRRAYLEFLSIDVPDEESDQTQIPKKRGRRQSHNSDSPNSHKDEYHPFLSYDPEWLAITRTMNPFYPHNRSIINTSKTETDINSSLEENRAWVKQNIVDKDLLSIPLNFQYLPITSNTPIFLRNNQTDKFCSMLEITNQPLVQQGASVIIPQVAGSDTSLGINSEQLDTPIPNSMVPNLPSKPIQLLAKKQTSHATIPVSISPPISDTKSYPTYEHSSDEEDSNMTSKPQASQPVATTLKNTPTYKEPIYESHSSDSE